MDPIWSAALRSWGFRLDVILALLAAGGIYSRGWWRLRKRTAVHHNRDPWRSGALWRPAAYTGGLVLLGIALMSPIDVLAGQLFSAHMIQHILLVMIIPPIILLANPLPFWLWGLPDVARLRFGAMLAPGTGLRQALKKMTGRGLVWLFFVIVLWGWHDPAAYGLALESDLIHDVEHLTFFISSTLFWWQVIPAGPRFQSPLSPLGKAGYVLTAFPPNMLAGVAITFAEEPIYAYYENLPRLFGLSVLEDQRLAGVIMWVPGSMMYIVAALIFIGRWSQKETNKPPLPLSLWDSEEALAAPGWKD